MLSKSKSVAYAYGLMSAHSVEAYNFNDLFNDIMNTTILPEHLGMFQNMKLMKNVNINLNFRGAKLDPTDVINLGKKAPQQKN